MNEANRIIEVIPGDKKGAPPKGVVKMGKPAVTKTKVSRPWKRLTIPKSKENFTHWMNRCMDYSTMIIEFPNKETRARNCKQLWRNWGNPDGNRKLAKLRRK